MKKNKIFIKYTIVSLLSAILDIGLYKLIRVISPASEMIATIIARVLSCLFNFLMNKGKVFESNNNTIISMIMYFGLVIVAMLLSGALVTFLNSFMPVDEIISKVIADTLIFIMNYLVQKYVIFRKKEK